MSKLWFLIMCGEFQLFLGSLSLKFRTGSRLDRNGYLPIGAIFSLFHFVIDRRLVNLTMSTAIVVTVR